MSASKSSKISKKTHKIIFLGDSGVGKTALIDKFANNRFEDFFNVPTRASSRPSVSTSSARTSSSRATPAASSSGTQPGRRSLKA